MKTNDTWQTRWAGTAIFSACLAVPLLGFVLAVVTKNINWLVLLAPLFVFMEGGLALILIAWLVVAWLIGK